MFSCNSTDKTKNTIEESSATETLTGSESHTIKKQFKPIDTNEALVTTALLATPEESRSECKVIGYNMAGEFVTFREGNNEFIVLVDNPNQVGFNTACYHKNPEACMVRGRTLRAEGKNGQEVFAILEAEMKSGKLAITSGSTLHI